MKDSRVISSFMKILTALSLLYVAECKNVLLIGDSVDRNMVTYWCKKHGVVKTASTWGNPNIRDGRKSKQPTSFCNNSAGDYFAAVHIFGSSNGPYLWVDTDKFSATSIRMKLAVDSTKEIGPLDEVIYNSELWDMRPQFVQKELEKKYELEVKSYEKNLTIIEQDTNLRLDELVAMIGDNVKLGLRTSAWSPGYGYFGAVGELFRDYNTMLRRLSVERNLTLYDYDSDLWSAVSYNYSMHSVLFLDIAHPSHVNSLLAGEKIMGQRFTKFYHTNTPQMTNSLCSTLNSTNESVMNLLHRCTNYSISLLYAIDSDRDDEEHSNIPYNISTSRNDSLEHIPLDKLYYSDVRNSTRYIWTNLTHAFLLHHRLGVADILKVRKNVLDSLVIFGTVSSQAFLNFEINHF